ncbi:MAG: hypothetical protein H6Q73_1491 [Firmicutes bacterium]|nr:hypothetical protein [Bacillota bacterium]
MRRQRGSMTIMAIMAMLVLATGAATVSYITSRNAKIAQEYANGLQAQYSAEAAVKTAYVAGQESVKTANGYKNGEKSALADWVGSTISLGLPGSIMGTAKVSISYVQGATTKYYVQALGTANGATRLAYNSGIDLTSTTTTTMTDTYTTVTAASLIASGNTYIGASNSGGKVNSALAWSLPDDLTNPTSPAKSPGYGTANNAWSSVYSCVLFNDILGQAGYSATAALQTVFRVNYYVLLTNIDSADGAGYGIYYLATKTQNSATKAWLAGDAGDPTAYVVQYDPGLNPGYKSCAWGAVYSKPLNINWPYGAFLVKKVMADGFDGSQNEVWDESGTYDDNYAFQDNNELKQRCYVESDRGYAIASDWDLPALRPVVTNSATSVSAPSLTRVPTLFGYMADGTFLPDKTGQYRERPPDLRIAYSLGDLAEGNSWFKNTYYPQGAKVAVGVYMADALDNRMVWVAANAGKSGASKPAALSRVPPAGAIVTDGTVTWVAQAAPTSAEIAKAVVDGKISIAKISMADLKYRIDIVNGTSVDNSVYSIPFAMVAGNKNKITIELVADNQGNRVQLIRVNDVLALAFNDVYSSYKHNIIPKDWELSPTKTQLGTGIKIWNAAALFYTVDNYGQTVSEATTITSNYGIWGM